MGFLESKEKEVLYCGKLGPVWQRGMVTRREHFVKVETIDGTNIYRLFDHVTVGVQLKGRDDQKEDEIMEEDVETIEVEEKQRKRKTTVNVYDFFQQMKKICVQPLECDSDND